MLRNTRNGRLVAWRVAVARSFLGRLRGLIGRSELGEGEALWIPDCRSIHTCFMKFPIDVLFIRGRRVVALVENLPPFRLTGVRGARVDVVELPALGLRASDTRLGDELLWEDA